MKRGRKRTTGASEEKSTGRVQASLKALQARGGAVVSMRLKAVNIDRIDQLAQQWRLSRPRTIWRLVEWALLRHLDKFI